MSATRDRLLAKLDENPPERLGYLPGTFWYQRQEAALAANRLLIEAFEPVFRLVEWLAEWLRKRLP